VLVLTAPGEGGYIVLLRRLDAEVFRATAGPAADAPALPLAGRKLHMHVDGTVE